MVDRNVRPEEEKLELSAIIRGKRDVQNISAKQNYLYLHKHLLINLFGVFVMQIQLENYILLLVLTELSFRNFGKG